MKFARAALLCALSLALPAPLYSQTFPLRPIRVIAPFPPGGGATEIIIRLIAPKMSEALGQPILIENRSGANGMIGTDLVARAAPDGYTLLYASSSNLATNVYLSKNVPFDALKDFTPISLAATPLTAFVVHASVPVNSIKEFLEYAKRNPGKLTYGSAGIGSMQHLTGEALKRVTGIDILHVPYKGAAPAINAIVAGQIDIYFPGTSIIKPYLTSKKIKLLALLEAERYPGMPNVPTVAETIPGFTKAPSWFAMFGPAGLPRPIVNRLNAETIKALKQPDVHARLDETGIQAIGSTPEQLAEVLKNDIERSGTLIRALGIEPE
jgi:tripartite-type tricarboxylate transporter receptor subunit TctC